MHNMLRTCSKVPGESERENQKESKRDTERERENVVSTIGTVHATHSEHCSNRSFAGPGAGTLKQGSVLR